MSPLLSSLPHPEGQPVAVGLSGGGDSTALAHALAARPDGGPVHALIVDHGLRPESRAEAEQACAQAARWPRTTAVILTLAAAGKPETRIQEWARKARYEAMAAYCRDHSIGFLYLAHHCDDQAETVLMRLAAGSGLDGLAGMRAQTPYDDRLTLVRPLLHASHDDLLDYCRAHNLEWHEDPSNDRADFTRVRLRQARGILNAEGLTNERLARTARRMRRATDALEEWADTAWAQCVRDEENGRVVLDTARVQALPDEIGFRLLRRAVGRVRDPAHAYDARMDALEDIWADLKKPGPGTKRTLGGCLITRTKDSMTIEPENGGAH